MRIGVSEVSGVSKWGNLVGDVGRLDVADAMQKRGESSSAQAMQQSDHVLSPAPAPHERITYHIDNSG